MKEKLCWKMVGGRWWVSNGMMAVVMVFVEVVLRLICGNPP